MIRQGLRRMFPSFETWTHQELEAHQAWIKWFLLWGGIFWGIVLALFLTWWSEYQGRLDSAIQLVGAKEEKQRTAERDAQRDEAIAKEREARIAEGEQHAKELAETKANAAEAKRAAADVGAIARTVEERTAAIESKGRPRTALLTPDVKVRLVAAFRAVPHLPLMTDSNPDSEAGAFGEEIRKLVKQAGKLGPEVRMSPVMGRGVVVFANSDSRDGAVLADELTLAGIPDVSLSKPEGMFGSPAAGGGVRLLIGQKPE